MDAADIKTSLGAATDEQKDDIRKDAKMFGGLQEHPTVQHMITYNLSDYQLDFLQAGGSRFTLLSSVTAFWLSVVFSCFLSGLTITGDLSAAQYAAFRVAPLFALVLAVVCGLWAAIEYKSAETLKKRIKKRSFEPGALITLKQLNEDSDV